MHHRIYKFYTRRGMPSKFKEKGGTFLADGGTEGGVAGGDPTVLHEYIHQSVVRLVYDAPIAPLVETYVLQNRYLPLHLVVAVPAVAIEPISLLRVLAFVELIITTIGIVDHFLLGIRVRIVLPFYALAGCLYILYKYIQRETSAG